MTIKNFALYEPLQGAVVTVLVSNLKALKQSTDWQSHFPFAPSSLHEYIHTFL